MHYIYRILSTFLLRTLFEIVLLIVLGLYIMLFYGINGRFFELKIQSSPITCIFLTECYRIFVLLQDMSIRIP
jgi:hypothetical protein